MDFFDATHEKPQTAAEDILIAEGIRLILENMKGFN